MRNPMGNTNGEPGTTTQAVRQVLLAGAERAPLEPRRVAKDLSRSRQRALWLGFSLLTAGVPLVATPAPGLLISLLGLRTLSPHLPWARHSLLVLQRHCPQRLRRWLGSGHRAAGQAA